MPPDWARPYFFFALPAPHRPTNGDPPNPIPPKIAQKPSKNIYPNPGGPTAHPPANSLPSGAGANRIPVTPGTGSRMGLAQLLLVVQQLLLRHPDCLQLPLPAQCHHHLLLLLAVHRPQGRHALRGRQTSEASWEEALRSKTAPPPSPSLVLLSRSAGGGPQSGCWLFR